MNVRSVFLQPQVVEYPESDGLPMSDNTLQFRTMVTLYDNLAALFSHRNDVFVGGNLFWYPVEGDNRTVVAPDVFVVFGRPPGHRRSYLQWNEDGVPMTVVFEILSHVNTPWEMIDKRDFYDEHGVQEYYLYDPEKNSLAIYTRGLATLFRVREVQGFVSPLLGIRFEVGASELLVYRPDGQQFLSFEQIHLLRQQAEQQAEHALAERDRVVKERDQIKAERDQAEKRMTRLVELSRKVRQGQATAEELAELERLEEN